MMHVTITIDVDLDKKLRALQAKKIQQTQHFYSFSQAINDTLRKVLK